MIRYYSILLYTLLSPFIAAGQSKFELKVLDFDHSVSPGGYFTALYDISTDGMTLPATTDSLLLPSGWAVLTKKIVKPDSSSVRLIFTVASSRHASFSDYPVTLKLYAQRQLVAEKTITISINRIRKVEVLVLSQPEYVREGDELLVEYLLQNHGNTTETFRLTTGRGVILLDTLLLVSGASPASPLPDPETTGERYGMQVQVRGDSLVIPPNTSQKITVRQDIPHTSLGYWSASSDLMLTSQQYPAPVFATAAIPVYSTANRKSDPYLRFPVEAGVGFLSYTLGNRVMAGYQYFLRGSGVLDFAKKHALEFSLTGPSQFRFPTVGSYDQYSVTYAYKSKTYVTAGDYLLKINNLMELGRFGRGAMVEQHAGKTSLMAFYQKTRFFPEQKSAFGGRISYQSTEFTTVALSFISKNLIERNHAFRSNLMGVASSFKKARLALESELSVGNARNKWDMAVYNQFSYGIGRVSMSSNMVYAGKNYYGFYKNSILVVNNLTYSVNRALTIGLNTNLTRINPSLDALMYTISPDSKSNTIFASYQPTTRNLFILNYTRQEREDKQMPAQFHFKESFGNFSYNYNAPKFTLFFQNRFGYSLNLLVPDQAVSRKSFSNVVQPAVRTLPWLWLGGYFEHQHTSKFSAEDQLQHLVYYGGNVRIHYKQKLNTSISYRNNYAPDEFFTKRSFMDATVTLDMKHHQFSLTGGRAFLPNAAFREQNTLFFDVKYILKLNTPLCKNRNLGSVSGSLKGLPDDINPGGILVQLGQQKVVTDSEGRFSFTDLPPEKYYLRVLSPLSDRGVIPVQREPMEVDIQPQSKHSVEVAFVRSGSLKGNVVMTSSQKDDSTMLLTTPRPVILVKLYNEQESFLTLVNERGTFSFGEIKPGLWNLKATVKGEQEKFEIVDEERIVHLEPGKTVQSTLALRPLERKVQFSKKSFNLSTTKKE